MDGHADLVGPSADSVFDWPEASGQGDLFEPIAEVAEPLGDVIEIETLSSSSAEPVANVRMPESNSCGCTQPDGRDFLHGACLPNLEATQRDRFLENCLQAQEHERLRLGRELHDSTGQLVLALRLGIAHLRRVHGTAAEESVLSEIDETARQLDREIRSFAFLQYPADVGRGGLVEALHYLARGFSARTGLTVRFSNLSRGFVDHDGAAMALLRVAQEALMNVHRHADAVHVTMSLAIRKGMLRLMVRDDGIGISSEAPQGVGLQGMRHRVERLGGQFTIRRLAHGTELVAAVPA
jgi:signal transduction histidine kinase